MLGLKLNHVCKQDLGVYASTGSYDIIFAVGNAVRLVFKYY